MGSRLKLKNLEGTEFELKHPDGAPNRVINSDDISTHDDIDSVLGGTVYRGSNGEHVQNGDSVPTGTTHLRVLVGGEPTIAAISPIASGVVSSLTESGATIGGTQVDFNQWRKLDYTSGGGNSAVENMIAGIPVAARVGDICSTGDTVWEINASSGVMLDSGFFAKSSLIYVTPDYGVGSSTSPSEVYTAIQSAISDCNDCGGGEVLIASCLNYGYDRNDPSTFPDLTGTTEKVIVSDKSIGDTYTLPSRDGSQVRDFFFTENQTDGLHDGNTRWHRAAWAPAYLISNDANLAPVGDPSRSASDNYRASYFMCANGKAKWAIQQGGRSGAEFTEDELTQFKILMNGIPDVGVSGLASALTIEKSNGWYGFHTNPISVYDFKIRDGETNGIFGIRAQSIDPALRLTNETSGNRTEIALNGQKTEIRTDQGAVYGVDQNGSQHTFSRKDVGDISLTMSGVNFSRRSLVRDTDGAYRIINSANTSATLTHDDSGNLTITGSYSPFTGTHLFFSKEKIAEGMAVDLISSDTIEYVSYIEKTKEEEVRVEIEGDIKPRLLGEDFEAWQDRCVQPRVEIKRITVPDEPDEIITVLNGTVGICNTPQSKICCGIVERQEPMEGGYLTYVAAVGDNKTENLKGFRVNGDIEAGDILCTDTNGKLKLAPDNISRSVVIFKAMSPVDSDGRCYGYFIG